MPVLLFALDGRIKCNRIGGVSGNPGKNPVDPINNEAAADCNGFALVNAIWAFNNCNADWTEPAAKWSAACELSEHHTVVNWVPAWGTANPDLNEEPSTYIYLKRIIC